MAIKVIFRGVGVYVPKDRTTNTEIREVLFPNAEDTPPDHDTDQDGHVTHADKSRATPHFAGALIMRAGAKPLHRRLVNRLVEFPGTADTTIEPGFKDSFPSLWQATNTPPFELKLLPESERQGDRVATRIRLHGGALKAINPATDEPPFDMPKRSGGSVPAIRYSTESEWSPASGVTDVTITVTRFSGNADREIRLIDPCTAYFYCFDKLFPSKKELKDEFGKCQGDITDHDFKWIYGLMDRLGGQASWQAWLGTNGAFPAPHAVCPKETEPAFLIPVSTCFQTFWNGQ